MTAAVYNNDIDRFIEDQKSKLATERRRLEDSGDLNKASPNTRGTWDKENREQKLAEQMNPSNTLPPKPPTPGGGFLNKLGQDTSKKQKLAEDRRREYNQLLAQKATRGSGRYANGQEPGTGILGLQNSDSTKRSRNPITDDGPTAPRRGWSTPTYEEMLQQKRKEESQYRRVNDHDYGMKSYGSEGTLDNINRRSFDHPQAPRRDPQMDSNFYATLPVGLNERNSAQRRRKEQYRLDLQQQMQITSDNKRREKLEGLRVNATGARDPQSREDRQRTLGTTSAPPPPVPPLAPPVAAPVMYKIADPLPMYSRPVEYDRVSPRSELVLGRRTLLAGDSQWNQIQKLDRVNFDLTRPSAVTSRPAGGGILDQGFETLLPPPRLNTLQLPADLEYQPSSYLTGGGVSNMNSLDDAYHYMGSRNPLAQDGSGSSQPQQAATSIQMGAAGASSTIGGGASYMHFDENTRRQPPGGMRSMESTDIDSKAKSRAQAQQYQAELNKQIEESKLKKMQDKASQEAYELKLEREAANYNPYGKGGGGAPMKDDRGNIIADLRTFRKGNNYTDYYSSPRPPSPRDDKIRTPPTQTTALGEVSHARGGHGIFGMPKTEAEKHQSDVYKDDLQRQIDTKRALAKAERDRERYEEEREMRRIEDEQKKMKAEFEEEQKKIKAKDEEARRKNEELMKQANERKKEAELRKREIEDERRQQQEAADRDRMEREKAERAKSPPIPTISRKLNQPPPETVTKTPSPSVVSFDEPSEQPTIRQEDREPRMERPLSRAESTDILNALAKMKHQLANERDRVEILLDKNENEPVVFDPRLVQRPPPVPRHQREIDVFEMARNRSTVPVRRAPTADYKPNPEYLHDFHQLKEGDTDSRQEFKQRYPYDPMSSDHLEDQQAARIRQQEENLYSMRHKSQFERALPNMEPRDLGLNRHDSPNPQTMLLSNSAFIDMNGIGPVVPDDLDELPRRNDSARTRRRDRLFSSPRPDSVSSLNVDEIARKNEQRLRRLNNDLKDNISLNDPNDVLDRFVSKQSHNRPPTSQTMQDDSWLLPGSKMSGF